MNTEKVQTKKSPGNERLQKIIAASGRLSRRAAEKAIVEGRVRVNGTVVKELGSQAHPAHDTVELDCEVVTQPKQPRVILFNKPRQVVTTKHDPQGRPTVMDYFKEDRSLNPVGRLEFGAEGLVIMTNIGELANRLMHPRYKIRKSFWVKLNGVPTNEQLARLTRGMKLDTGFVKIIEAKLMDVRDKQKGVVQIVTEEGGNQALQKMFIRLGLHVDRIRRTQIGPLELGKIPSGKALELRPREVKQLRQELGC